nr:MAG TPA: hypothetical protein [Caudoviricetes sp.]
MEKGVVLRERREHWYSCELLRRSCRSRRSRRRRSAEKNVW